MISTKNGLRVIRTRNVPVVGTQGKVTHILGFAEDVTQQMAMQEEILNLNAVLRTKAEDLEASNKSLESFAAAVTHDLRSPLSVISGYAGLLEKNYGARLDDKARRHLAIISSRAKSMGELIDDLLAFSKLGHVSLSKATVDMEVLVAAVLDRELQALAGPRPEVRLGPLPPAQADAALLQQVWANLLTNAIKYSRHAASPLIEVSGCVEGDELVYSVRDNGAGFSMDDYDKLFEVFQRLHTDDQFEGIGVGLPIVQRIVQRHGGRVWAEGEVGRGAVFHFALPVAAEGNTPGIAAPPAADPGK